MSTSTKPKSSSLPAAVLLAGDVAAIFLFALIGLSNHKEGITVAGLARNVLPILAAWAAVAPIVRTYRDPSVRSMLATWIIAVSVGVVIRAVALQRDADGSQVVFGLITLATTGLLLLVWRGIAGQLARRRPLTARNEP